MPPPVRTGAAPAGKADSAAWSPAADAGSVPFSSAFTSRSVEDTDKFVLAALASGGEGRSPRVGPGVEGELDALAFAMGALWELAAESDINQVRPRKRAKAAVRGAPSGRGHTLAAASPRQRAWTHQLARGCVAAPQCAAPRGPERRRTRRIAHVGRNP